jgi:hypothetical protein
VTRLGEFSSIELFLSSGIFHEIYISGYFCGFFSVKSFVIKFWANFLSKASGHPPFNGERWAWLLWHGFQLKGPFTAFVNHALSFIYMLGIYSHMYVVIFLTCRYVELQASFVI